MARARVWAWALFDGALGFLEQPRKVVFWGVDQKVNCSPAVIYGRRTHGVAQCGLAWLGMRWGGAF